MLKPASTSSPAGTAASTCRSAGAIPGRLDMVRWATAEIHLSCVAAVVVWSSFYTTRVTAGAENRALTYEASSVGIKEKPFVSRDCGSISTATEQFCAILERP